MPLSSPFTTTESVIDVITPKNALVKCTGYNKDLHRDRDKYIHH